MAAHRRVYDSRHLPKNRDQLRNPTLGNRVRATFTFFIISGVVQPNPTKHRDIPNLRLHQAAPLYLTDMCIPVSAIQRRHGLWSAVRGDLEVPRCNLARYGQRSFYVSGPSLWNSLPLTVRDSSLTRTQFCTRLKTFLFTRAYGISP